MLSNLLNYLFFSMKFNAAEGDGGGGSGDGGDAGDAGGDGSGGATGRPEGLEDSFWDGDKGEVRLDSLIKSHNDTRKSVHDKEEAVRERLMGELQSARPDAPDGYEIKELGVDAPEGFEIKFSDDDPMVKMWRDMCFQNNSSNDQFMEGIRTWVQNGLDTRVDPVAEEAKLGENGPERVQRIELLMNKHLDAEQANSLADTMLTAESIVAMEKLIEGIGASRLPDIGAEGMDKGLTIDNLKEMMQDVRYHGRGGQRSEEFIQKVQQGFAKLKS